MAVEVKICGIRGADALDAALDGGARFVGFVFYPPSPRFVPVDEVAALAAPAAGRAIRVGLFVDPDDATLGAHVATGALDLIQVHGRETPERVAEIKRRHGLPVMKAVRIATAFDVASARAHVGVADRLLFDAAEPSLKALPADAPTLPGGNGRAFDWSLLAGVDGYGAPWMLSGGLSAANLADAVAATGARVVDVSSGVEATRGVKSPLLIREFLAAAAAAGR